MINNYLKERLCHDLQKIASDLNQLIKDLDEIQPYLEKEDEPKDG